MFVIVLTLYCRYCIMSLSTTDRRIKMQEKFEDIEPVTSSLDGKSKPVLKYGLDGKFIEKYPSASEAAKALGKTRGSITNACNGNQKTAYGFMWRHEGA